MIKAPYNFVPLSEKVFFPDEDKGWNIQEHGISHDIPFKNFKSGEILITVETKTETFIANNSKDEVLEFCNFDGKKYIPGSSLKGVIRNILEIMSFSRIETQSNKKYSYRDINHPDYKARLVNKQNQINCGWLYKENGVWKIIELPGKNKDYKITHEELSRLLDNDIVKSFPSLPQRDKTPEKKYSKYNYIFNELKTSDNCIAVFTGTVDPNNDKEFKFPIKEKSKYDLTVDEAVKNTFLQAYYIGQPEESKVWNKMWSKEFKKGGLVPIFYLKENNELKHFGLSLLYKLPYDYSVSEGLKSHTKNEDKIDLTQSIFGFIKNKYALKGRVQFSHCTEIEKDNDYNETEVVKILSNPKPSFFPMYIEQDCANDKLKTMNDDFNISGWKRYPLKNQADISNVNSGNTNVIKEFKPIPKGIIFHGKIRYHNLRLFELGAILSALTLHGHNGLFHNIGMAKPFGFGRVKIGIALDKNLCINAIKEFENKMNNWHNKEFKKDWIQSAQLKEILSMLKPTNDNYLHYEDFNYYGNQKKKLSQNNQRDCREGHSSINAINVNSIDVNENSIKKSIEETESFFSKIKEEKEKALKDELEKKKKVENKKKAKQNVGNFLLKEMNKKKKK